MSPASDTKLSQSAEDYLEAIGNLCCEHGAATISDIAAQLNVKKPSVTAAVRLLAAQELIVYVPYSPITLTAKGKRIANRTIRSHRTLHHFLKEIIGLSEERADSAACEIEHILTPGEIDRIGKLIACMERRRCTCEEGFSPHRPCEEENGNGCTKNPK